MFSGDDVEMNNIVLITDSSCDLPLEYLIENKIILLPLTVEIKGKVYKDILDLKPNEFYELIKDKDAIPKTAAVNMYSFEEIFKAELEKGNEVLYIGISSEISGTFSFANQAKELIASERIHLLDSRTAAFGQGLLVIEANKMIKEGKNIQEILNVLNEVKLRMDYAVALNKIEMLKRSGRISGMQAFAGNLLNIKPIISVEDGKVNVTKKVRGTKMAINFLVNRLDKEIIDFRYPLIICYGTDENLKNMLEEKLKEKLGGINIQSMQIGATVGSHTGDSGIGTFFVRKE